MKIETNEEKMYHRFRIDFDFGVWHFVAARAASDVIFIAVSTKGGRCPFTRKLHNESSNVLVLVTGLIIRFTRIPNV